MSLPWQSRDSAPTHQFIDGLSRSPGQPSSKRSSFLAGMEDLNLLYQDQADRKKKRIAPEKVLQFAVMMGAVGDLKSRIPELQGPAKKWIDSAEQAYPFSFLACCESFDLDPSSVRKALGAYLWRDFNEFA